MAAQGRIIYFIIKKLKKGLIKELKPMLQKNITGVLLSLLIFKIYNIAISKHLINSNVHELFWLT